MISGYEIESLIYEDQLCRIVQIKSNQAKTEIMSEDLDELVTIVQGWAELKINDQIIKLNTKDSYFIQRKTCHQVSMTSEDCIWICCYYKT